MIAGRYRLIREIGRGGMGAVWLGTDEVLGRSVALKQLTPVEAGGATASRAQREAKLAARLNHRNIVAVFDLAEDDGLPWLVMEYIEGPTLSGLVAERGPLSPDETARILAGVTDGLRAAHEAGVIHRDVKPSNILVAPDGRVKLTDFGIARGVGNDMTLTQTGLVTGSPAYLSPEVAAGGSATPASDVWSLGATLYFAVTGRAPYDASDNVLGALYKIVHEEPPRTPLAGWLAPVLDGTLVREPQQRWELPRIHDALTLRRMPSGPEATQVMTAPARPVPAAVPPPAPAPVPTPTPTPTTAVKPAPVASPAPARRSGRWLFPVLLLALVVVASAGALLLGLDNDDRSANPTTAASSAPASPSPSGSSQSPTESPSESATDGPTAEGVTSFVDTYLRTAASEPPAGFAMLTPEYQDASGGLSGYESFWGGVAEIEDIAWIEPQLGDGSGNGLGVDYKYTYRMDSGERHTEQVHLDLTYSDGTYLIAGAG
ncbi:serine/threonine-protein kinase [Nocardioides insulae]|uniref:serine/threonine-protein kinase n=1 Tax=Nocardioides insulae TaxID=394734 RepID=UPI000687847B|nr:serine/threonine-protein kinase [Nocardioides insulae]